MISKSSGISILLPCYESDELLYKFFYDFQSTVPTQIIFYDNGGNECFKRDFFAKKFDYNAPLNVWMGNGNNRGVNVALNECARHAYYDHLYLAHSDMYLLPGWDSALLKEAKRHAPGTYLFCSRSIEPRAGHTPFHLIQNFGETPKDFKRDELEQYHAGCSSHGIVTGYRMPFFIHKKLWEKMNGVDEWYFSYTTDDDLFLTSYDVGVRKFWMINESLVYHMSGQSNAKQKVDRHNTVSYHYLATKWKHKGYRFDLPYLDQNLQQLIPWNIKVR